MIQAILLMILILINSLPSCIPFFDPPKISFFRWVRKYRFFDGYKKGTWSAHGLTQNLTSRSNFTQKSIWVLGDKIIDLLRVSAL